MTRALPRTEWPRNLLPSLCRRRILPAYRALVRGQKRKRPIVNGGRPAKKRHTRSPPPWALHLTYSPTFPPDADPRPSCGMRPAPPFKADPATVALHLLRVRPSDASALNPGRFTLRCFVLPVLVLFAIFRVPFFLLRGVTPHERNRFLQCFPA